MALQTQDTTWAEIPEETEIILEEIHTSHADRIRKFGRNFFSREVEYDSKESLRKEYLEICEILMVNLPSNRGLHVLERLVKPSYLIQKERFNTVEV